MALRRNRTAPAPAATPVRAADRPVRVPTGLAEPWRSSLTLAIDSVESADTLYRPTSFWQPGLTSLMADLEERGLDTFKRWPSSLFFFYPIVRPTLSYAQIDAMQPALREHAPAVADWVFRQMLTGSKEANADMDVVLAYLDTDRLPLDVTKYGESVIGDPPQRYRPFGPEGPAFGKPHLNYLKLLAAVSRYIDSPLQSVVEIGSGCGVLGEILKSSIAGLQYVNLDIPPLSTIAHYYLSSVFPEETFLSNLDVTDGREVAVGAGHPSASLSSWQLPQLRGTADLFVNSFSFQEMEPHVVENYARLISGLNTRYVVSLNSRDGKPLAANAAVGVEEQVTSQFICDAFAAVGYEVVARLGRPAAPPQAELAILRRTA